jgi:hypothetical protein
VDVVVTSTTGIEASRRASVALAQDTRGRVYVVDGYSMTGTNRSLAVFRQHEGWSSAPKNRRKPEAEHTRHRRSWGEITDRSADTRVDPGRRLGDRQAFRIVDRSQVASA